ncbi:MerR family transcriptional regulator [Streptomyces sp. Z26]|uniref:MerR family transcriptional regulator n=1 Tax=Streptomyces sp. Z26 TaxID=2500177 RepID=UPI000EF143A2|nr:MerR family transcriptional regulator [Streptomyces sp. Z26]RLL70363.1 MerR family transcriptional regulator [Streptomyces sp. Z26]
MSAGTGHGAQTGGPGGTAGGGAAGGGDTAGDDPAGGDAEGATPPVEYRADELATAAGITPRTLRFYRERKLLPPPRREGRIAWYDEHHLARLRTIAALLARGHTLGGIADLMTAFEEGRYGRSPAELLGLDTLLSTPFSEEVPIRLTPQELADHYEGGVTSENLADSLDIGYLAVDGEEFVHVSRRLLEASSALVREGIPLGAVLAAGRELRHHTDVIAAVFSDLLRSHVLGGDLSVNDADWITEKLERLHPLAKQVVEAELGLALDRRVREELDTWLLPPDGGGGDDGANGPGATEG